MTKISCIDAKRNKISLRNEDTRLLKIRKFKEHSEISFVDFVIDGESLYKLIASNNQNAPSLSTILKDDFTKSAKIEYIKRLLGEEPADLESGRVAILVCPFDGDLMCDAVGCRIKFNDDTVIWNDFAWDGNMQDEGELLDGPEHTPVNGLDQYRFNRSDYEALLSKLFNEL